MLKVSKKILNTSLAIALILGLGGCGISQSATTTHKNNQPSSAKVVKHSGSHKAITKSNKYAQNGSTSVSSSTTESEESTHLTSSSGSESIGNYQQPTTGISNANSQSFVNNSQTQSAQIKNQPQQQSSSIQLGLGDIAVWTDQYGVVHHVDSDGMDRMTIPGSDQVKYQDWSGPLPANAQIVSSTHSNVQLGLGDIAVWTDEYGVTHHVDSDGMDRMTIPGSNEVKYQDWSGYLPSNVTIEHEH
ncbi:hypothetical protein FD27_GL001335 [Limosilactobacillus frumenti DSM 13145]|uniref:Lipoprotein n=1 Tax=Limosilactobacillus frumenti DSM 13145 TaxID=1423746 RepID=A0A0R1P8I1_9LACO|nr:hypothetical protein [Limosilactobacillus frumenti]KRL26197.1 hypothetical protein FD27_GL001335 [Limosilactobacillus frumenti DSM 13145]